MNGVFNNLIMFDQHVPQNSLQSIVPDLATSWSWNEDGTELTFQLRQGVKFHDGKLFTARDVKCTFDLRMDLVIPAFELTTIINIRQADRCATREGERACAAAMIGLVGRQDAVPIVQAVAGGDRITERQQTIRREGSRLCIG